MRNNFGTSQNSGEIKKWSTSHKRNVKKSPSAPQYIITRS